MIFSMFRRIVKMKILRVKDCPVCGIDIWDFKWLSFISFKNGLTFNIKKVPYKQNEKYAEFWALLSNGSRMRIAICLDCLKTLTDEQVKRIFADITYTKLKAIEKDKREDMKYRLFDAVRDIGVWRWSRTEQEIINYLDEKNDNTFRCKQSS